MRLLAPSARPRGGSEQLVADSRQELLRQIRAVVLDVAPDWRPAGFATIMLTSTSLGLSDVRAAFDEIDERYHVEGIDLSVEERGGHLRVTLSRAGA
jgi:hypothetical protein